MTELSDDDILDVLRTRLLRARDEIDAMIQVISDLEELSAGR